MSGRDRSHPFDSAPSPSKQALLRYHNEIKWQHQPFCTYASRAAWPNNNESKVTRRMKSLVTSDKDEICFQYITIVFIIQRGLVFECKKVVSCSTAEGMQLAKRSKRKQKKREKHSHTHTINTRNKQLDVTMA